MLSVLICWHRMELGENQAALLLGQYCFAIRKPAKGPGCNGSPLPSDNSTLNQGKNASPLFTIISTWSGLERNFMGILQQHVHSHRFYNFNSALEGIFLGQSNWILLLDRHPKIPPVLRILHAIISKATLLEYTAAEIGKHQTSSSLILLLKIGSAKTCCPVLCSVEF